MSNAPLMPKATAVWLVDNTALTFDQVADFTKMHPLEVRAIADGDAAQGIKGMDPISTGQLTRDEIEKGEKDPNYRLKLGESKVVLPPAAKKKGPRYTPVSRRHERPSAILWLVRNHPELKDAQIMRLVGTTKTTIASVRDRTHWNASTLTPMDPVTLGLCSQIELDFEVQRAAKEKPVPAAYGGATLLPASETTKKEPEFEPSEKQRDDLNVDAVFAKLKTIGGKKQDDEEEVARHPPRRRGDPSTRGAVSIRSTIVDLLWDTGITLPARVMIGSASSPVRSRRSISCESATPPTVSTIFAGSFSLPLSLPAAIASRTAFSISRCEVMPTFLRNLRRLVLKTSSFMRAS